MPDLNRRQFLQAGLVAGGGFAIGLRSVAAATTPDKPLATADASALDDDHRVCRDQVSDIDLVLQEPLVT